MTDSLFLKQLSDILLKNKLINSKKDLEITNDTNFSTWVIAGISTILCIIFASFLYFLLIESLGILSIIVYLASLKWACYINTNQKLKNVQIIDFKYIIKNMLTYLLILSSYLGITSYLFDIFNINITSGFMASLSSIFLITSLYLFPNKRILSIIMTISTIGLSYYFFKKEFSFINQTVLNFIFYSLSLFGAYTILINNKITSEQSKIFYPLGMGMLLTAPVFVNITKSLTAIPFTTNVISIVFIALLVYQILKEKELTSHLKNTNIILICLMFSSVILFLPLGVAVAIIFIIFGYYTFSKTIFSLGVLGLHAGLISYYYNLDMTLLNKSLILTSAGLGFLTIYWIYNKTLTKIGK